MKRRFDLATAIMALSYVFCAIGVAILFLLVADELLVWLRSGMWRTLLMKQIVSMPDSSWVGVQKITHFVEELPFAIICIVPTALGWVLQNVARAERARRNIVRAKSSWPPTL